MHQNFLNESEERDLGGRTFDEVELESMFKRSGMVEKTPDRAVTPDELILKFCPQKPVDYLFESNQIKVNICASSIRLEGKDLGAATLSLAYHLRPTNNDSLEIARSNDLALHSHSGGHLPEEMRETITARFDRIFPWKFELGRVSLPSKKNHLAGLVVSDAITSGGWFKIEMQLTGADKD